MADQVRKPAADALGPLAALRRTLGSGSAALADQALMSLANFGLSAMLARQLGVDEFGAYSTAQATLLLFGALHTAVLAEPLVVFMARRSASRRPSYLATMLRESLWFGSMAAIVMGLVSLALWMLGESLLASAMLGLAIVGSVVLTQWLLRRACYALSARRAALHGAIAYLAFIAAGLGAIVTLGRPSIWSALLVIAIANGGSIAVMAIAVRAFRARPMAGSELDEIRCEYQAYGKWASGTAFMAWLPGSVYYVALPAFSTVEHAAALRALTTTLMPAAQLTTAVGYLLLPALSKAALARKLGSLLLLTLAGLVAVHASLYGLLVHFRETVVHVVVGEGYLEYAGLLVLFGVTPLLSAVGGTLVMALKAQGDPRAAFRAQAVAAVVALCFGVPCTYWYGLVGSMAGNVASLSSVMVGAALMVTSRLRRGHCDRVRGDE